MGVHGIWPHHANQEELYTMQPRSIMRRLSYFGIVSIVGMMAVGCATRNNPALDDINRAREAIDAARQANAGTRFPDQVDNLEQRHRAARGVYYACNDAQASQLARAIVADADALRGRLVAPPPPPPAANRAPRAVCAVPAQAETGMPVTFDGTQSADPDGDALAFQWAFGDGETASQASITHQYARPGNYTAQLTVRDNRGGSDTCAQPVTVIRRVILQESAGLVLFDFNRATLRPEAQRELTSVVREMQDNPQLAAEVIGHTDAVGTDTYNLGLSRRRADAVRSYLVSQGIAANRIQTRGLGESQPVAPNDTAEGRARNRRVEVTLRPLAMQ